MADITITLAGKDYTVGELRLRALRDIHTAALIENMPEDPQEDVRRFYDRTAGVIAAALRCDHPEMTLDAVLDLAVTRDELIAANNRILQHAGLVPAGEAKPGEAGPGNP